MQTRETADQSWSRGSRRSASRAPGLLAVFSGARTCWVALPLEDGRLRIGRKLLEGQGLEGGRISREHAEVALEGGRWIVEDLGSRNGTFVDGARVEGERTFEEPRVVCAGDTLFLPCRDLRPLAREPRVIDGLVIGPTLSRGWEVVERAAGLNDVLHLIGETGSGKELAARHFHAKSPRRDGPFVAVNCASIPTAIAERLLFGARRGAYSGADTDSEGYLQAADGGTLFLDEIGELESSVQAKLLRALESREVLPLGASRPRTVSIALCSATHVDLRRAVGAGRFREDLYYRIGRPSVTLPPLRERTEDISRIVEHTLSGSSLTPHASLIEAALVRPWPGNVRELLIEIRAAGQAAMAEGAKVVEACHLAEQAGRAAEREGEPEKPEAPQAIGFANASNVLTKEILVAELQRQAGNVTQTAAALGLHRTQLRRILARLGVDPRSATAD